MIMPWGSQSPLSSYFFRIPSSRYEFSFRFFLNMEVSQNNLEIQKQLLKWIGKPTKESCMTWLKASVLPRKVEHGAQEY